jgi:O-antigen/teichoic acid export membrane protein
VSLRRTIPAGLLDAGFSSLATLAMGLYAARRFELSSLGAYAVFFTAFLFVAVIPAQALFVPAEIASLRYPGSDRLRQLGQSLRLGAAVALPAGLVASMGALVLPPSVARGTVTALAVTTILAASLSPIQDHVRRMLHLAGRSWRAAAVSAVQFATIIAGLIGLESLGVPTSWIPFGSLALANAVSLGVGLFLAKHPEGQLSRRLKARELARSGRWLLIVGAAPSAASFVAAALVARLASPATLGYAEAARIVAQPLLVVALGLSAVLGPRSMEAAALRDVSEAHRIRRIFVGIAVLTGSVYFAVVGFTWRGNPLAALLPSAYVVGGLVPITVIGNLVNALVFPDRSELMGGHREPRLATGETLASFSQCAVSLTAGVTQSFARPLGVLAQGITRQLAFRWALRGMYGLPAVRTPEQGTPSPAP